MRRFDRSIIIELFWTCFPVLARSGRRGLRLAHGAKTHTIPSLATPSSQKISRKPSLRFRGGNGYMTEDEDPLGDFTLIPAALT
jgi:hypothetical protein